jgi:hypothetical protein
MKKALLIAAAMCLVATAAVADYTVSYSWEDGVATLLGSYGNLVDPTNVTGMQNGQVGLPGTSYSCPGAFDGMYYLHVAEETHSSTPQSYLVCVTGILEGDAITASFYAYDITLGTLYPSWRLWGHYSDATTCLNAPGEYTGSASGPADYSAGTGWDYLEYTWVIPVLDVDQTALVVEGRLYSTPTTCDSCRTDYWGDLVSVTVPDHCTVTFPDGGPSATEASTWGSIKSLYR